MAVPAGGRRAFFWLLVLAAGAGVPPALADFGVPASWIPWLDHFHLKMAAFPHFFAWYQLAGLITGLMLAFLELEFGYWRAAQVFGVWVVSVALTAAFLLLADAVFVLTPLVALGLMVGGFLIVWRSIAWLWWHRHPRAKIDTHGSAEWGTKQSATIRGRVMRKGRVMADSYGFALGRVPKLSRRMDARFRYMGHLLTCAPTGAGKGVGSVIPTLLEYPGSALVMDIKGENYKVTARARRELGHEVFLVDPFGVTGEPSHGFNWLSELDPNHPDAIGESGTLADMLVLITAKGAGEAGTHFDDTARDLLRGLLLHVAGLEDPELRTMGELRRRLGLPLASTDDTVDTFGQTLVEMQMDPIAASGVPCRAANAFVGTADREKSSILSTVRRHTAFLDDPRIVAALSKSDFRLSDLKKKRMTVYVVMPPARLAVNTRFLRGFIGLSLAAITASSAKPEYKVLFLLDEFGQLGRMQAVEDAISLVRGYGAAFWLFVQDLSQLKAVYPRWQTFLANSAQQFFGTADLDTARYLSERLGQETIGYATSGTSAPAGMFGGLGSASTSGHFSGRALLTPDEVMGLPRTTGIVLVSGEPPYQLRTLNYLEDAEYKGQFDKNPYQG